MAVTTIFLFFYGTRPTQYKVTPTSQYKVTSSFSPNSQLILAPFLDGRRFVFAQSLPIGALPAATPVKGDKVTPSILHTVSYKGLPFVHYSFAQKQWRNNADKYWSRRVRCHGLVEKNTFYTIIKSRRAHNTKSRRSSLRTLSSY